MKIKDVRKYYTYWTAEHGPNANNVTVITCAVLDNKGCTARGMAICSNDDEPRDHVGKSIAYRYAMRILKGRCEDYQVTRKEGIKALMQTKCPFTFKYELNPDLSYHEQKALKVGIFQEMKEHKEHHKDFIQSKLPLPHGSMVFSGSFTLDGPEPEPYVLIKKQNIHSIDVTMKLPEPPYHHCITESFQLIPSMSVSFETADKDLMRKLHKFVNKL